MSKCQQMLRATAWELVVTGDGKSQGPRLVWVCSCVCVGNRAVRDKIPAIFCLTTRAYPHANGHQRELCSLLPQFWSSWRPRLTFPLTSSTSKMHRTGS